LIGRHRPDVLLTDISMPGLSGLELARRVTKEHPGTAVIIVSVHAAREYVWQALRAGAAGYLLKDADTAELELAIRAVARGETYLTPAVSKHVVADYIEHQGGENNSLELLTPRQREVLRLIAEGHTTKGIANILSLSVKTVETHRAQLMERLGIHDVAGLVRYAIRAGLIEADG
jgi:DNA-binding NarL/FixJ family response regulator